jgi:hypothetical protein
LRAVFWSRAYNRTGVSGYIIYPDITGRELLGCSIPTTKTKWEYDFFLIFKILNGLKKNLALFMYKQGFPSAENIHKNIRVSWNRGMLFTRISPEGVP